MIELLVTLAYGCFGGWFMALFGEQEDLGVKLSLLLSPLWPVVLALFLAREIYGGLRERDHRALKPWFRPVARWWQGR